MLFTGSVVGAAEAAEVGEDGGASFGVAVDVVVLEEVAGVAAGVIAVWVAFVEDALLAEGGESAPGAGVDGPSVGVVDQQADERVGQECGDGVGGEWGAVGEGEAVFSQVDEDLGVDGAASGWWRWRRGRRRAAG